MASHQSSPTNLSHVGIALLAGVAVLVVTIAALSLLTNNVVLISITGIIVGATFTLLGNIINVAWLEPLQRKQRRKELEEEQDIERSKKETNLRLALYDEIIIIASIIGGILDSWKEELIVNQISLETFKYMAGASFEAPSFRAYDSLKDDPAALYQLNDALYIDLAFDRLKVVYSYLERFEKPAEAYDSIEKAREACLKLIGTHKRMLSFVDWLVRKQYTSSKNERLCDTWVPVRKRMEESFGHIESLALELDGAAIADYILKS